MKSPASNKSQYRLNDAGEFIIDNYNSAKPFSSFFPGIAGTNGIPMWVFYVNRGQAIASFGVKDKDSPIMEFQPANKAYRITPYEGFRTLSNFNAIIQPLFTNLLFRGLQGISPRCPLV